jgi:hypothetical protein
VRGPISPRAFRRCEPPIMSGFSNLSTTCEANLKFFLKLLLQVHQKACACKKRKTPLHEQRGFRGINPGDDLLSHGLSHTTIGAAAFHFRVRDGIGWFHSANFTREAFGVSPQSVSLQGAGTDVPALQRDAPERLPLVWSCDVACTWDLSTCHVGQGNLRLYGQATRIISIS